MLLEDISPFILLWKEPSVWCEIAFWHEEKCGTQGQPGDLLQRNTTDLEKPASLATLLVTSGNCKSTEVRFS